MKIYVVVNKKGKLVKEAGAFLTRKEAQEACDPIIQNADGEWSEPSGEKVKALTVVKD